jgi:branched-subunit amino acid transport protein
VTPVWTTIGILAVVGAGIKAAGPVAIGGRELPGWAERIIVFLPAALLSALIVVEVFASNRTLTLDARAVGLTVAVVAVFLRAPMLAVVIAAAAATAVARALGAA